MKWQITEMCCPKCGEVKKNKLILRNKFLCENCGTEIIYPEEHNFIPKFIFGLIVIKLVDKIWAYCDVLGFLLYGNILDKAIAILTGIVTFYIAIIIYSFVCTKAANYEVLKNFKDTN